MLVMSNSEIGLKKRGKNVEAGLREGLGVNKQERFNYDFDDSNRETGEQVK